MKILKLGIASIIGFILLLNSSCEMPFYEGKMFYVHKDGAEMPVWVRGNVASKTAILIVHGGPGDPGLAYAYADAFQDLESRYALVYYDQRLGGNNHGNAPIDSWTPETLAGDLKAVTDVVQSLYKFDSFFVLGMSWGGMLSTIALSDTAYQAKVKGWINIDGTYSMPRNMELMRLWIMNYATTYLAATPNGSDASFWQSALVWYTNHPVMDATTADKLWEDMLKAGGRDKTSYVADHTLDGLFGSPVGISAFQNTFAYQHNTIPQFSVYDLDYSSVMGNITLPSIMLWGAEDGNVPVTNADEILALIGTIPANKSKFVFAGSQHCTQLYDHNTDLCVTKIAQFVETYK